jgi:histidinol-phosphate aminotransferase
MSLALVIGGTRSGKSVHAERIASSSGLPVRYIATADGSDRDMAKRIAAHVERRQAGWEVVEVADVLTEALAEADRRCLLLDGLGAWIGGIMHRAGVFDSSEDTATHACAQARDHVIEQLRRLLLAAGAGAYVVVVAEHAGEGLLPPDVGSRNWLDLLGEAVQMLSASATRVDLVVAGRAVALPAAVTLPAASTENGLSELRHHGDRDVHPGDADHAVNVMAGGPPGWLRDALRDTLESGIDRYPDEREACEAIAAAHERDVAEVVPTNGAAEALWLLGPALQPRLAACVHPAFTESEAALRAHGVPVLRAMRDPEHGFAIDPTAVPPDADLVVIGNPASPSGTLDPVSALLALRRPGRTLVVDEAFMDLVPGEPATLVRERLEDVIVIRSLTKTLAIPGLRAGYALAAPGLAERLRRVRPPWSANALALAALAAAARRPDALVQAAERAQRERDDLAERLRAIPSVRVWPGAANFCLVEVPDGQRVVQALRDRAIAVRSAASFPGLGADHLRVTARDPDANERLANALAGALSATCQEAVQ